MEGAGGQKSGDLGDALFRFSLYGFFCVERVVRREYYIGLACKPLDSLFLRVILLLPSPGTYSQRRLVIIDIQSNSAEAPRFDQLHKLDCR